MTNFVKIFLFVLFLFLFTSIKYVVPVKKLKENKCVDRKTNEKLTENIIKFIYHFQLFGEAPNIYCEKNETFSSSTCTIEIKYFLDIVLGVESRDL